jgi:NDP-sugar pyrophosphorylase family protein
MIAMIFAAGLGTRLAPLTDNKPKALVEFNGRTMLENAAQKLVNAGCDKLVVNVHHFPEMMKDFIKTHDFGAEVIISDETDMLLETGGGMLKARKYLEDEPHFILYNVDVDCDIDIATMYINHIQSGALATLAVMDRKSTRSLIFDSSMRLCAWKNNITGETKISWKPFNGEGRALAFSGISVASNLIFDLTTETGKFSITDLYLRLAKSELIEGYIHAGRWADLGSVEKIRAAEQIIKSSNQ